ncbi:MAG: radical SAM protein [Deltaproteobacteria bacterium]|nr:radical SAM protein [Deltaproteobacteria bacterium]MCB9479687.1 radical SAM protein [Deltaproteobacteria bacterium]MCB9488018.1 radical SAM protein [Deltaproteobacteria bacterium]
MTQAQTRPIRKISFVYTPYGSIKNEPGIKVVKDNYGVFPSLSLAYVAGVAEHAGYQIQFIDAHALGLSKKETVRRIKEFDPDLVAYTLTTYLFHQNLEWIDHIKQATGLPQLVGGVHMGIYPKESFHHSSLDYALTGEAEEALPELLDAINNGRDLSQVTGIVYRDEDGNPVVTPPRALFRDVDNAPFPARHHLPNHLYYSFISQYRNFTALITSRGCPFRCIFCEQGGLRFRPRSPENISDEIDECVHVHGIKEFDFFDSSFTTQKKRVIKICEEIINRGQHEHIAWAIRSRVDLINEEMLRYLKEAGCKRIYYGIESGNEEILKTLKKETTIQRIKEVVRETNKVGIDTFGYFMVGNPGETEETVNETIQLAKEIDLDYAQFSKVTPMPATAMYDMLLEENGGKDYWREFVITPKDDLYIPRPKCDMSEEQVQRLARKAYLKFYFRPRYILFALLRVKSLDELWRSAHTALLMLFQRNQTEEDGTPSGEAAFAAEWDERVQY